MKHKKLLIFTAVIAVICTAVILIESLTPGLLWAVTPSGRVKSGLLDEVGEADHIDSVPKGEIRYLINNNVVFKYSGGKGTFMFENPESCEYDLVFTIYEIVGDGQEENIIYKSPVIRPGECLSGDKLGMRLGAGTYNCLYCAQAYSGGEYAGERTGDLTITVLKKSI